jgi:hypothetical protein
MLAQTNCRQRATTEVDLSARQVVQKSPRPYRGVCGDMQRSRDAQFSISAQWFANLLLTSPCCNTLVIHELQDRTSCLIVGQPDLSKIPITFPPFLGAGQAVISLEEAFDETHPCICTRCFSLPFALQ